MPNIPETNFKFSFEIELVKDEQRWIWRIKNHKHEIVGESKKSLETKEDCKSELSRLATSIKEYLEK